MSAADKLITDALRVCQARIDTTFDPEVINDARRHLDHVCVLVAEFGIALLSGVVRKLDPAVADQAAKVYVGICDDGGSVHEWVWELLNRDDGWDQLLGYVFDPGKASAYGDVEVIA